jgi:hypothetical protein
MRIINKARIAKNFPRLMNLRARVKKYFIPKYFKKVSEIDIAPIFIVGTNRSGGSLISSLIGQHPKIENITKDDGNIKIIDGHTSGFTDSNSFCFWMEDYISSSKYHNGDVEGDSAFLWGHPKYISKNYRDQKCTNSEMLRIANDLQNNRKTEKIPLIKHSLNSLKLCLWKQVFPKAKFIFNYRDYNEFIASNRHKWAGPNWDVSKSKIGLHWYTVNSTVYYDLMHYFPNSFVSIKHNDLYNKSKDQVQVMLNEIFKGLGLSPHNIDLKYINPKYKFVKYLDEIPYNFDLIEQISQYEKSSIIVDNNKGD